MSSGSVSLSAQVENDVRKVRIPTAVIALINSKPDSFFYLLVSSFCRVGSRLVEMGRPQVAVPLLASVYPFLAGELLSVITQDLMRISPSGKNFSLQQACENRCF